MAYDTTDQTDTAPGETQGDSQVPPEVVAAFKEVNPGFTDSMIGTAWKQAVANNPSLALGDPKVFAQNLLSANDAAKGGAQSFPVRSGGPITSTPLPQTVDNTEAGKADQTATSVGNPNGTPTLPTPDQVGNAPGGSTPPIVVNQPSTPLPTPDQVGNAPGGSSPPFAPNDTTSSPQNTSLNIPTPNVPVAMTSPYAGAGYTQADLMKAYNPEMMKEAAARQVALTQSQMGGRIQAASAAAQSLNPGVMEANSKTWAAIDANNALQGTGLQDLLQKQSTAGIEAAGKIVDQMDKSGRFQMDMSNAALAQKKLQLELIGTAATSGLTQKLMNSITPESAAARNSAIALLTATKLYTPAQIAEMVPLTMNGISAANIGALAGGNLKDLLTVGQTQQAKGAAAASYAAAGLSNAEAQKAAVATAGMVQGQTFNQGALGMPAPNYSGTPQPVATSPMPGAVPEAGAGRGSGYQAGSTSGQVPQNTTGYQMQPTIGPTGEVTWQPSTLSQQAGRETSATMAATTGAVNNYLVNGGKDAAMKTVIQAPQMGGVMANAGKNILNYTQDPAVKNYELTLDRLNQEAADIGLITPKGGASGTGTAISAGGAQIAKVNPTIGTALAMSGHLFNGGQPVSSTTNAKTVQQLAIAVQEARDIQQAQIPYQQAWARTHGGDMTGYIVPPAITDRVTMVNPTTGEVQRVSPQQAITMAKDQGWKSKDTFLKGQ